MLRKWLGPRALLWHVLALVIVAGCLVATWWQVQRAIGGNSLSYLYSAEWPIFAIVAVVGWWQLIMEHPSEVEARKQERRARGRPNPIAFDQELLRRELTAHPDLVKSFPELARAFPELAPAFTEPPPGERDPGTALEPTVDRELMTVDDGERSSPSEELRSYNDALAALAATGKAKSWRNPHGRR